ncbi:MAG: UDP-3-O-acyl-N-acetylglucosamine deacetylase [Gloeomargarita sp. HHBFW_bins_162]
MGERLTLSGVGLHTGQPATVTLMRTAPGTGRVFYVENQAIPAQVDWVRPSSLCTTLAHGDYKIHTIEHLLAALVGLGIQDVAMYLTGQEIPLLDGSALPWVELLQPWDAGQIYTEGVITEPLVVQEGDSFAAVFPASELKFTYGIDFPDYPAIGRQWCTWVPKREDFAQAIAPARTFGLAEQVDQLRQQGLIRGGSLENALVCDRERGWLNPPLRFPDEPVRHKLLDFLGDLALLGALPQGHFLAYKAGHRLHTRLAGLLNG